MHRQPGQMIGAVYRERTARSTIATLLLAPTLASQSAAAKRVALVIGDAEYKHSSLLANPLNDAADIGAALSRLGLDRYGVQGRNPRAAKPFAAASH